MTNNLQYENLLKRIVHLEQEMLRLRSAVITMMQGVATLENVQLRSCVIAIMQGMAVVENALHETVLELTEPASQPQDADTNRAALTQEASDKAVAQQAPNKSAA